MRLASAEVKTLLVQGRRTVAHATGVTLAAKTRVRTVTGTGDNATASPTGARLALAVPKRHLKRAVDRNRVKRALRESFRADTALRGVGIDLMVTLTALDKPGKGGNAAPQPVGSRAQQLKRAARAAAATLFARVVSSQSPPSPKKQAR